MRDTTTWGAAGYGGLLGATICAIIAAGGHTGWYAAVWLAVALTAVVSLSAAPHRRWLTRGLPIAYAVVAAIAWAAGHPDAILHAAPCAACTTICIATIRCASTREGDNS